MILYFSTAGNSKYIAAKIAAATGDRLVSIAECYKSKEYSIRLQEDEPLGIVCSAFHWGLPLVADDFLQKMLLRAAQQPYIFFVAAYRTTAGQTAAFVDRHLAKSGFSLSASFGVKLGDMRDAAFDLGDADRIWSMHTIPEGQIETIAQQIESRARGHYMKAHIPTAAVKRNHPLYREEQRTRFLRAGDRCLGCGPREKKCPKCAVGKGKTCPDGKGECRMCLGLLHPCHKAAARD